MKRPNILLIHSDQHRYDAIRTHGNEVIRTPNLDRLAAEGATFPHAFSTCPICTPARASLLTGAWPTTHRSLCIPTSDFYQPARRELPVLTELLDDAGYYVGWVGKYHGELEGRPTDHGVHDYVSNHGYRTWAESVGLPDHRRHTGGLFGSVLADRPSDQSPVAWQADRVLELIGASAAQQEANDGERPFFVRWDPPEPHLPCHPAKEFHELYEGVEIPPWASFPDALEGKPEPQRRQHDVWGTGGWTWEDWEPIVRLYYAIISEIDHHVGRMLARLDELGLSEDTLVVYTCDHGDFAGGHGLFDKHFNMYDDVLRVPLIARWPGHTEPGSRPEGFVSQEIDLARTVLEVAGIDPPESFVGRNVVSVADGTAGPRQDIFSQYFGTESGMYSSRMLRDDRWKYAWNALHRDELYDLEADPGELTNVYDDPRYADELARLRGRLVEWMEDVGDPLCNAWTKVELLGAPNAWERATKGLPNW
ncbi:MAG: sulfatase-like hydrolase/transferase [Spirochaetota bacterium]